MTEHISDYLLVNWDLGVTQFFAAMVECFGVREDDEIFILLKDNVRDMIDLNDWIDCFDGNTDYPAIRETTYKYIDRLSLKA